MSDTNTGQQPAEGQTAEPMPSSEQPAENVQQPTLPDGVKERTAQEFEKLKESNRVMAEKLKALEGSKPTPSSVLDELRPSAEAVQNTAPAAGNQSLVDTEGYIDANLLNSTLNSSQKAAQEARSIALQTQQQIQRFQESQVVQAVHKDFPEIDPNSDQFDPSFYDYVKNDLIGQMMKGKEDLRAAAEKARNTFGKKPEPEQRKETISSRGQASAPTGTSKGTPDPVGEHASLVEGTYKGDKEAIYKRLQASGN